MENKPWVRFFSSNWLAGTSGLTVAEKGVFITLCALIYEHDGPIVRDDGRLARRCGCPKATFTKILAELVDQGKIDEANGFLVNSKCLSEIDDRNKRSENGRALANKRWKAQGQKSQRKQEVKNAAAMPPQCDLQLPKVKREGKPSPKKAPDKGFRLPENWELGRADGEWAVDQGMAEERVRFEADKFRDYWRGVPGAKGRKVDWSGTWRNWIRKALDDAPRTPSQKTGGSNDRFARILAHADAKDRANGRSPSDSDVDCSASDGAAFGDSGIRPEGQNGHGGRVGNRGMDGDPGGCSARRNPFGNHGPAEIVGQVSPDCGGNLPSRTEAHILSLQLRRA